MVVRLQLPGHFRMAQYVSQSGSRLAESRHPTWSSTVYPSIVSECATAGVRGHSIGNGSATRWDEDLAGMRFESVGEADLGDIILA